MRPTTLTTTPSRHLIRSFIRFKKSVVRKDLSAHLRCLSMLCILQVQNCVRFSFLPERRSGLCYRKSVCRLSVTFVHPTQGVEAFGNISSPLCTLAIIWPPCKILHRSSREYLFVGGVKRKRGSKIEQLLTYWRLYLIINGTRYGLG